MKNYNFFLVLMANVLFSISCTGNGKEIEDAVLVVPDAYKGVILIFYEQVESKGKVEFKKGKHYFYVDSTGVFFTTKKMGLGGAVTESFFPNMLQSNYSSEMSIDECPDEGFRVVGGAYRGFKTKFYKKGSEFLNFSVFKAGQAKTLKNGGWYVSDSLIEKLYRKYL